MRRLFSSKELAICATPIDQNDTNPTVRECFLGFCVLASTDMSYFEPPAKSLITKKILCYSVFPKGYILVTSLAEGKPLNVIWDDLTLPQKDHVRAQCRKAISILRSKSIWIADTGKQNVLFQGQMPSRWYILSRWAC